MQSSGSCIDGFFLPNPESNFIATSVERWHAIGGIDTRYDDFGGGYAYLDLYKRLLEHPDTPCYLLFGEGTFHQFHGGVTTGTRGAELLRINRLVAEQDRQLRGDNRSRPRVQPIFFGSASPHVHRFIRHSLDRAAQQDLSADASREC